MGRAFGRLDPKVKKVIIDNHIVISAWLFAAQCFPLGPSRPMFCGSPILGAMDGVVLLVTGEAFVIGYRSPHICRKGKP
jgi:hypothetical protein